MKIVDPKVAIAMLNRTHDQIPPLRPDNVPLSAPKLNEAMVSSSDEADKPQQLFASMPMNGGQFGGQPSGFPGEFTHEQIPQAMSESFILPLRGH